MAIQDAIAAVKERFGARLLEVVDAPSPATKERAQVLAPYVRIEAKDLPEVMAFLKGEPRVRMDLLACLTAVDYPKEGRIQLVYSLDSVPHHHGLDVRVDLPRESPRAPTIERIYRTADWHEREAYDLMGVHFEGHSNLTRILCAEDWEGHPLRKDYVSPEFYHDIPNNFEMFYDIQNPI